MSLNNLSTSTSFKQLQQHRQQLSEQGVEMRHLFAQDAQRFEHFSLTAAGVFLDYSKNHLTAQIMPIGT
jgi:glucose-6-phosphate isomerase